MYVGTMSCCAPAVGCGFATVHTTTLEPNLSSSNVRSNSGHFHRAVMDPLRPSDRIGTALASFGVLRVFEAWKI